MAQKTIQLATMSDIESLLTGGFSMKNWKIEVIEPSGASQTEYNIIAPASSFILYCNCWENSGTTVIPTLTSESTDFNTECIMNFSRDFVTDGVRYPIVNVFFKVNCNTGDPIKILISNAYAIHVASIY